ALGWSTAFRRVDVNPPEGGTPTSASILGQILPLTDTPPAIDRQHHAREEAGLVTAQEHRRVAAVVGISRPTPERLLAAQEVQDGGIVRGPRRHRRVDQPRGD